MAVRTGRITVRSANAEALIRKRLMITFAVIFACYILLVGRLVFLQVWSGRALHAKALHDRLHKMTFPPHRGTVFDRDGKPLALSVYAGDVGFDPSFTYRNVKNHMARKAIEKLLDNSIKRAADVLHIPEATLSARVKDANAHYNPSKPNQFILLQKNISQEVADKIQNAWPPMPSFGVHDGSQRVYSGGPSAAQVVGYTGPTGGGVAGIERSYNRIVRGTPGIAKAELDEQGREIPGTRQGVVPLADGLDVHTTLDATAQHIAMEEAAKIDEKYHPIGISIVAVAPDTGDLLALVSYPTFDPNPGNHKTVEQTALIERCACRLYEPGSTLKAITVAAALEDGTVTESSNFYCSGSLKIGKKVIHCAMHGKAGGHGPVTPLTILRHSCNIGAAQIGMKMGPASLYAAERRFGLLSPLHIGLPFAERGRLSFDSGENIMTNAKVARVAFGHSISTTPVHVAMAYAALANGGILMKPRLISSLTDRAGHVTRATKPEMVGQAVSPQTADTVRSMLCDVVASGTGKIAAIPGYEIAGKTGTANKYRRGAYVGSFIGFLPAHPHARPKLVLLVAVDEPHGQYYGAEVAAPAFHAIAQRLMEYWHVPKDDPTENQFRLAQNNLRREGLLPIKATGTSIVSKD